MDEGVLTNRHFVIATALPADAIAARMRELVRVPQAFRGAKPRFIGSERGGTWSFRQNLPRRGGFRPRISARVAGSALEVTVRPPVVEFVVMALIVVALSWIAFQTVAWGLLFIVVMAGFFWMSFVREARGIEEALRREF